VADRRDMAEVEQHDFADGGTGGADAVRRRPLGGDDIVCFVLGGVSNGGVVELGSEWGGGTGERNATDRGG
jgi:hypothetical protein